VFSLDLVAGVPRAASPQWRHYSPLEIAADVVAAGIRRLIVLDVAAVGVDQGCPSLPLCRQLRDRYPKLELTSGGGVRDDNDLSQLAAAGCNVALVASALHNGRIGRRQLEMNGRRNYEKENWNADNHYSPLIG
jgi:phosphoribosylformimino-5-aminoimidazole carboxamide ribotide isomerase